MKITRTKPFTNESITLDLPVTEEQYSRWMNGELAQNAFPHLNADDREFIISGIPPGEWDSFLGNLSVDDFSNEGTQEYEYTDHHDIGNEDEDNFIDNTEIPF